MISLRTIRVWALFTASIYLGLSQNGQGAEQAQQPFTAFAAQTSDNANQTQTMIRPDYVLGPNDQVLVRAPDAPEINERQFRVDADGFITFPVVGKIKASGLTVLTVETDLIQRLSEFIRSPQVSIRLVQFRNEPVFVMGAFRSPGIYPLQGRHTLTELLSSVGGLQPNASPRIKVTRRAENGTIDLPNAVVNPEKKTSTVEISLESLTQNLNPQEDLVLRAYDIVTVERGERVYVSGDVGKAGAIELGERSSISLTQAITEAGGFTNFADRGKIRVLRPVLGTTRRAEIVMDANRVFTGKAIDFPLLPNDVLFVPRSASRGLAGPIGASVIASLPYVLVTALLR
jgi:polysaccharide biosynthesis/export protein